MPVASAFAGVTLVGFEESGGFHPGVEANGIAGWAGDAGASVVGGDSQSGSQHLQIGAKGAASVTRAITDGEWGKKAVGYYDFWVRPMADASEEPETTIAADGAKLAFIKDGENGVVAAYDAKANGGGESALSDATFAIDESGVAKKWLRITLREDYAGHKWDVYVDGKLALANLGMDGTPARPGSFAVTLPAGQSMGIDAWQLSEQQPLFKDSDDDGMPDDFEKANGLDPNSDDRNSDPDGDGIPNIEEYRKGSLPGIPGAGTCRFIYVNNQIGDDTNSGQLTYAAGRSGPKASIHGAIKAAAAGDFVVVLPGSGHYREGDINVKGKQFNLKIVGDVHIE